MTATTSLEQESDLTSGGLYLGGEYILPASSWLGFRPYTALLWTWSEPDDPACELRALDCEIATRALALGGKGRFVLPIAYFAPFIEMGVGVSVGLLKTKSAFRERTRHLVLNFPLKLGVALGADHSTEIALFALVHPAAIQLSSTFALGFTFPLGAE